MNHAGRNDKKAGEIRTDFNFLPVDLGNVQWIAGGNLGHFPMLVTVGTDSERRIGNLEVEKGFSAKVGESKRDPLQTRALKKPVYLAVLLKAVHAS
jgi:hypothetical protein